MGTSLRGKHRDVERMEKNYGVNTEGTTSKGNGMY